MNSKNQEDIYIGGRVRIARLQAGYTQADLAKKFSISPQQIQKFEKGVNRVSARMLYRLSVILDKPVDWFLMDLEGGESDVLHYENASSNRSVIQVVQSLNHIRSQKTQKKLCELIKVLADNSAMSAQG